MSLDPPRAPLDTPRRPPRNRAVKPHEPGAPLPRLSVIRAAPGAPLRAAALLFDLAHRAHRHAALHAAPQATSAPRSPPYRRRERLFEMVPQLEGSPNSITPRDRRASAATRAPCLRLRAAHARAVPPASRAASAASTSLDPSRSLPERRDLLPHDAAGASPIAFCSTVGFAQALTRPLAMTTLTRTRCTATQARFDTGVAPTILFIPSRLPPSCCIFSVVHRPIMSDERKERAAANFGIIGVLAPDK